MDPVTKSKVINYHIIQVAYAIMWINFNVAVFCLMLCKKGAALVYFRHSNVSRVFPYVVILRSRLPCFAMQSY